MKREANRRGAWVPLQANGRLSKDYKRRLVLLHSLQYMNELRREGAGALTQPFKCGNLERMSLHSDSNAPSAQTRVFIRNAEAKQQPRTRSNARKARKAT